MAPTPHVLVVDDDFDARCLLDLALSSAGYAVEFAANGAEALAASRRLRPDVILLDLKMPVMDGFAFRAAQLVDPGLAAIPVICVSGEYDADEAARSLKLEGFVAKPFSLDDLMGRVGALTGRDPADNEGGRSAP